MDEKDKKFEEKFNKAYGRMFNLLREQRNFKITDFKRVGLSQASLSRFENGQSLIRFDTLDAALNLMGIEIGEFEYFCNDFQSNYRTEICQTIEEANYAQDMETIKQIHDEAEKYDHRLIELATKNLLQGLTEKEKNELRNQFFVITEWSFYELSILSFCVENISVEVQHSLLRDFWNKNFHYMNVPKYREKVFQIACRAAFGHIKKGEPEEAKRILEHVNKRIQQKDIFPIYMKSFVEGAWDYKFGDKKSGNEKIQMIIASFKTLEDYKMSDYYEIRYKELLKSA
ncbi:MAG: helix-turn-helix domain-containing protein [Streptococcaceae bacterium]|jgi:Rgg/GadR/MutR family transcriptional activator|nr:helix-turn-helix domain-containing protein [Streptococcaceae bacterium]